MEDTNLRFMLCDRIEHMPYGWSLIISGQDVRRAWPPTGDHDRSIEAIWRSAALGRKGHRPEKSYTTEERLRNDLGEFVTWNVNPMNGDYGFHKDIRRCPRCHGAGSYEQHERCEPLGALELLDGPRLRMGTYTIERKPCDHSFQD